MPASRIAFALGDLMNELRAISQVKGEDGPEPTVEVWVDAATFNAVLRELEDRLGQPMPRDAECAGQAVRFQGMRLLAIAGPD
jgi:hypothetical protein